MSEKTSDKEKDHDEVAKTDISTRPRVRADARRNVDALLQAAVEVFATSGIEAPVREIAERAGVGIGTLYRHFPERSDLVVAVFRHEVDACAAARATLAAEHEPDKALEIWMQHYVDFIATKRGVAAALHSGDPAYSALPDYFDKHLRPSLQSLLDAAIDAGTVRTGINADDLLKAVASLCLSVNSEQTEYARRMVSLLVDGLRYTASSPAKT